MPSRASSGLRLALAAPSLADDNPPPSRMQDSGCTTTGGHVPPPTTTHVSGPSAGGLEALAGYSTWEPEKRDRILCASTRTNDRLEAASVRQTAATLQGPSSELQPLRTAGDLPTDRQVAFTIDGVYLAGDGALSVQIRRTIATATRLSPTGATGRADRLAPAWIQSRQARYRLIAIRKDSRRRPSSGSTSPRRGKTFRLVGAGRRGTGPMTGLRVLI